MNKKQLEAFGYNKVSPYDGELDEGIRDRLLLCIASKLGIEVYSRGKDMDYHIVEDENNSLTDDERSSIL